MTAERAERARSPEEETLLSFIRKAKRAGAFIDRVKRDTYQGCHFHTTPAKRDQEGRVIAFSERTDCPNDAAWFVDGTPYCAEHTRKVAEIIIETKQGRGENEPD